MARRVDVVLILDGSKITIEFPSSFFNDAQEAVRQTAGEGPVSAGATTRRRSEKEMIAEKKPRGHGEKIAVLAFCLRETGTLEFDAQDLRRAYIRAGEKPPRALDQAMRDARKRYDFLETGSRNGTFKLSDHGESTVLFDLPRQN